MGSRVPAAGTRGTRKMNALLILSVLLASASAIPGGYTGLGGLYKTMNQNADYMPAAKNAARMAVNLAFEQDESLIGAEAARPSRSSVYVPTFFTSEPQPLLADGSLPQLQGNNRQAQTFELPLYYNA